jgi:hypothetical protein
MYRSKVLAIAISAAMTVAACSGSKVNSEERLAMDTACMTVASAYNSWAAMNARTDTDLGAMGLESTQTTLDQAVILLSEYYSADELAEGIEYNKTDKPAKKSEHIAASMIHFYSAINNLDSEWAAGSYVTIDNLFEKDIVKRCDSLDVTLEEADSLKNAEEEAIAANESELAALRSYTDLNQLLRDYESAGGFCPISEEDTSYALICRSEDGQNFVGRIWISDPDPKSFVEKQSPGIYGADWFITMDADHAAGGNEIAEALGGVFIE